MGGGDTYEGVVEVENDSTIGECACVPFCVKSGRARRPLGGIHTCQTDSTHESIYTHIYIELGWLSEATTFADAYLSRLQDPSITDPLAGLPGTGDAAAHATLYEAFRRVFPTMDVGCLDADDPLGYVVRIVRSLCSFHAHRIIEPKASFPSPPPNHHHTTIKLA